MLSLCDNVAIKTETIHILVTFKYLHHEYILIYWSISLLFQHQTLN